MKTTRWLQSAVVILISSIGFFGCDSLHAPTQPDINHSVDEWTNISAANNQDVDAEDQKTHCEAVKKIKYENGGKLKIDKVFSLQVTTKSMNTGTDTEIFGEADLLPDGTMRFHFEPSGLHFDPPAQLTLKWQKMDVRENDTLKLYYIMPNGQKELISNMNDNSGLFHWDKHGKNVIFEIPHFSLYSLSRD
jgi:hypothetical protein